MGIIIFPSCDNKGGQQEEPEVVVPDTTKVLDDESAAILEYTSEDYSVIAFNGSTPLLESLAVNDVLVSSVYPGIPYGFLRRITGLYNDGSQLIISTEQATLNDAFDKARIREAVGRIRKIV